MRQVRLTLCQLATHWQAPQAACQALREHLATIAAGDVLILPEMFASGFSMQPQAFVEQFDVPRFLQDLACERNENILAGLAELQGRHFFNNAIAIDQNGIVLGRYTKQRCFTHAGEEKVYQAGNEAMIVDIAGVKTALFICYDLRFPELFRTVARQVELMVVLANWPHSRQAHWQILLQARAIENQCFVIGVNRTGTDGNGLAYAGGSMVVDPNGEVLLQMGDEPFASITMDCDWVRLQRKKFAFLADYRPTDEQPYPEG